MGIRGSLTLLTLTVSRIGTMFEIEISRIITFTEMFHVKHDSCLGMEIVVLYRQLRMW